MNKKLAPFQKDLVRRYLIWCYKTTKESLDKIDRYFTQLIIDGFMLKDLKKGKDYKSLNSNKEYVKIVDDFEIYMNNKEKNVLKKKFKDSLSKQLTPDYLYLQNRFKAIEHAICEFLGEPELKKIKDMYEKEMTLRILQAREHN